ncbi:1970_t:CDS:2, partial [Ambispora leptoticha]
MKTLTKNYTPQDVKLAYRVVTEDLFNSLLGDKNDTTIKLGTLENTNPKNNQSTDRSPTPPVTETKPNNLITTIGQLLPFAPLVFEQFTGQKVPPMTGTMADI